MTAFMGAFALSAPGSEPADAILFGAPHGTPYPAIDNRVHEDAAAVLNGTAPEESLVKIK